MELLCVVCSIVRYIKEGFVIWKDMVELNRLILGLTCQRGLNAHTTAVVDTKPHS